MSAMPSTGSIRRLGARGIAARLGLHYVSVQELTIRRRRAGGGWTYLAGGGRRITNSATIRRFKRLAVPPAYADVLFAQDEDAHLQAIGRDAAGRLQYRYHAKWEHVRELRKTRRLARLADALPHIRKVLSRSLAAGVMDRAFACAAVVELVAQSAIRAGGEKYARERGTRGAATLLKSNVTIRGSRIILSFQAKGQKATTKDIAAPRLARAFKALMVIPGRRFFQYLDEEGRAHRITARDVNAFLRVTAGGAISLKDFRMLLASTKAMSLLAQLTPAPTERKRRRQILEAIQSTASELNNTPAICRKSYVHHAVVAAFEAGKLRRFSKKLKASRSPNALAAVLRSVATQPVSLT